MKPKAATSQCELFGARLSELLNPEHPLYVLAERIDWSQFDAAIDACYADELGRPGVNTRRMVGLLYLKHTYDESDESVVARWVENPYWQFFCGCQYMQHDLPIDPSSLSKWRKRVGASGWRSYWRPRSTRRLGDEGSQAARISAGERGHDGAREGDRLSDRRRLYHKMRVALVRRAKSLGLVLRQSYRFQGKRMLAQRGRYAYARQMKRAAKMTRQLQTILGRVVRDIEPQGRQIAGPNRGWAARRADRFGRAFARSNALSSKNKLYSVHAPEVECICKGKVHKRYEFGCKTSVATTSKSNWIVGTQALHGNPYDGHTLDSAIGQVERLTGRTPNDVMVDQGYRGHGYAGSAVIHVVRTIPKQATRALKRMLRRRAAIRPTIGHLKSDNRMNRNYLTGREGDKINAVLSAAGYNLRKLLRWVVCADFLAQVVDDSRRNRSPPRTELDCRCPIHPSEHLKSRRLTPPDHLSAPTM